LNRRQFNLTSYTFSLNRRNFSGRRAAVEQMLIDLVLKVEIKPPKARE
jgi:hypothetical protein